MLEYMQLATPPKGISGIIRLIEEEDNIGTFVIETDYRPEIIGKFSNLLEEFFKTYNGDFHNLLPTSEFLKKLPQDMSFQEAETASYLFHLGPDDGNQRHFVYERVNNHMEAFLETLNQSGECLDRIPISDLDQTSFPILAGIAVAPLVSIDRDRKKIGIVFDGTPLDFEKWEYLRDYLKGCCTSNELSIFLVVFTGGLGTIDTLYSNDIDRVGIYTSDVFTKVNSFKKSMSIVYSLVSSLQSCRDSSPILFFLGAGASIHAGISRTRDLMTFAMRRLLGKTDTYESNFENLKKEFRDMILSQNKLLREAGETRENLKITFERIMTEELSHYDTLTESPTLNNFKEEVLSKSPSVAHYNLVKLVDSDNKPIFLTTNYDDLIERSLEQSNKSVEPVIRNEDFQEPELIIGNYLNNEDHPVPVFKFHGCIRDFESIKASVKDTLSLEPNKSVFLTRILKGDLMREIIADYQSTVRIVFIGYSFNDLDINYVLRGVQDSNAKIHAYFVNPNQRTNSILLGFARNASSRDYLYSTISLPFSIFSGKIESLLMHTRNV